MKQFTEEQIDNDIRCQVANEIKYLIDNDGWGGTYIENVNGVPHLHIGNVPTVELLDGKNGEQILIYREYDMDDVIEITFIVGQDFVIKHELNEYPTGSSVKEIFNLLNKLKL